MNKILKFEEFLNEAESPSGPGDTIVYVGAGTTNSNITDSAAKKMGVEKDKKYRITLKNIGYLAGLGENQTLQDKADKNAIKMEEIGGVKPGEDYLKIGENEIIEKGDMKISKKDFPGEVVIEAANNGILALYRIAGKYDPKEKRNDGIAGFYGTLKQTAKKFKPFSEAKDYIIEVKMGAPVSGDGRFSEWMGAWSGASNSYAKNGFLNALSAAVVQISGGTVMDQILKKVEYVKTKSTDVPGAVEWLSRYSNGLRKGLLKRKFLVNSEEIKPESDIKKFLETPANWKVINGPRGTKKVTYSNEGKKALGVLWEKIEEEICKSSRPEGFSQSIDPLLPEASKIVRSTFGSIYPDLADRYMERVQRENEYKTTTSGSGGMGSGNTEFEEGAF